jgi:hypothetical protein
MRWENEGGAVLLRRTGTSVPAHAPKTKQLQKSRPTKQPTGERQSVMEPREDDQAPA